MKLFVLGASGGIGKRVLTEAMKRGHTVTAHVRRSLAIQGPTFVRGDMDSDAVREKLAGTDAVISCLGLRRKNPKNPFSPVTSPADLLESTIRSIIPVMQEFGVRKLICVSAAGVGDSKWKVNLPFRLMIAISKIGIAYEDMNAMEEVLANSGLDWMAVRPVTLTDEEGGGRVDLVDYYGFNSNITRADVARYMLDRVAEPGIFFNRTPMIANAK
jgi:putative NADH-flavin reductase